jgi:hypothetical protein
MQTLFNIFDYIVSLSTPLNIWPYLLLILPPVVVFAEKPETAAWLRVGRLVAMVLVGYVLINLSLHTHHAQQREAYEQCKAEGGWHAESWEGSENCKHHINIANGASDVFYMFLGWWPVAAYVALLEYFWRRKHRRKIHALGKHYKGSWFSYALYVIAVPVWLLILIFILVLCYVILLEPMYDYLFSLLWVS